MPGPDDINDSTKNLQELGAQANEVGDIISRFFRKMTDDASTAGISIGGISASIDTLSNKIKDAAESFTVMGANANFSELQDPLDKLTGSFLKLEQLVDQSVVFKQFSVESSSAINTVTANMELLQKTMNALHIPGANLITSGIEGLIANANEAEKLETAYIALSAAGGDLGKVFDGQGGQLKDLSAITAAYTNTIANAADATGLSVHQSMEFGNAIKAIPGFMDQFIQTNIEGNSATTTLIESMKLMTGTGRSQADVIKSLNTSYDDLSTSQGKINDGAQKGAEFLATISSVSTGLKLRFDDVRQAMEAVAEQFQFIGNETDAAARVLGRYTDALRETGLTSKASIDITQEMIKGISDLNIGKKAFMSLQAGGPGGLQGAFQIEQLLRQGKLDQVMQMAERNLKQQFGGRIYTQAEAAQSPEAAAQFMRQRQLLQSGVFGIGAGMRDDQATRLLEALGKGDTLAATKEIKTGQDALTAVTKQGSDIQARNNNELKTANRFLERNAIASELIAGATVRQAFGTAPGTEGPNAAAIRQRMQRAGGAAAIEQQQQRLQIEGGRPDLTAATQQLIILGRQAIDSALDATKGAAKGGVEIVGGLKDAVVNSVTAIGNLHSEIQSQIGKVTAPEIRPTQTMDENHKQVLNNAVKNAVTQQPVLARNIAATAMHPQGNKTPGHETPKKVLIEIIGPPGFHIAPKSSDPSVILSVVNNSSTVVGKQ
jgi:archaellum component FlaC